MNELRAACVEQYHLLRQKASQQRLTKQEELLAETYLEGSQVTTQEQVQAISRHLNSLQALAAPAPAAAVDSGRRNGAAPPARVASLLASALPPPQMTEFELPTEYGLMRVIPYQQTVLNRYQPEHRPKKLKASEISVRPLPPCLCAVCTLPEAVCACLQLRNLVSTLTSREQVTVFPSNNSTDAKASPATHHVTFSLGCCRRRCASVAARTSSRARTRTAAPRAA